MTVNLDYIDIDNTSPIIRLWQQYKKNDVTVSFFNYLKTYWQERYFDYLDQTAIPSLSVYNASNNYLNYYANNLLGIKVPIRIENGSRYDIGAAYDSGIMYDVLSGSTPLTYTEFRKVLLLILDWSRPNWDIPTMYHLIADFTGLTWDQILIEQSDTNLSLITITLPGNTWTLIFELMINYYKDILGFPFGMDFAIIITA